HALAPDDGGGAALAGEFGLPRDVGLRVPLDGRVGAGRRAVGERSAPVGPVVFGFGRIGSGRGGIEGQGKPPGRRTVQVGTSSAVIALRVMTTIEDTQSPARRTPLM